jgi:hypothetical protein
MYSEILSHRCWEGSDNDILSTLPQDVINKILVYTGKFRIEKGKPVGIIAKDDERYRILEKREHRRIYDMYSVTVFVNVNTRKFFEISVELIDRDYVWMCRTHSYATFPVNPLASYCEYRIL